jgi:hypothetical protein
MKTKLIFITMLTIICLSANAQIPNSGFENWTIVGGYEDPTGWGTANSLSTGSFYAVTKSTDNYPIMVGNYSVRIESDTALSNHSILSGLGLALTGNFAQPHPVFKIIGHPTSLTGYYKCTPQNSDTIRIGITLYLNGTAVSSGALFTTSSVPSWTAFNIPLSTYTSADSGHIFLGSYYTIPQGNSVLYVDNLNFDTLITPVIASKGLCNVIVGDTAILSVVNSGATFDSIQWQQSTDSIIFTDIPGATSNPQSIITTISPTGKRYFQANILCINHIIKSSVIQQKILNSITDVQLGDWFRGGIVFWKDSTGQKGLIAPTQDQGNGVTWGCPGTTTNATSTTDGATNTTKILAACSTRPIAASTCDSMSVGYTDWFLPAKDQLNDLFLQQSLVGGFGGNIYQSSTEGDANNAYIQNFFNGVMEADPKYMNFNVRAVRSFGLAGFSNKTYCTATVTLTPVYQNEKICLVSVDTTTWKNKVIWEKPINEGVAYVKVYKETAINDYSLIGTVPINQPSYFIDYSSQPESHSDKYKISVIDSCEQESAQSCYHKTINLTIAVSGTTMGLNWNNYEDECGLFIPGKFYIFKGSNISSMALYDSISASFLSYNDVNVNGSYYYMIGVKKTGGCNINKSISDMTFSNSKQNFMGIDELNNEYKLEIFPNPFTEYATISLQDNNANISKVIVTDISGKELLQFSNCSKIFLLNRGILEEGFYFVDVFFGNQRVVKPLIVLK